MVVSKVTSASPPFAKRGAGGDLLGYDNPPESPFMKGGTVRRKLSLFHKKETY
jgi:hypothetical protein